MSTVDSQGNRTEAEATREVGYAVEMLDGVMHVDATIRRKRRLKAAGARPTSSPERAADPDRGDSNGRGELAELTMGFPVVPSSATGFSDQVPPARQPEEKRDSIAAESSSLSAEELATFLVNFVVEQTGYPPEIVEMDADLEADLGIDSIKKAQLFGELREHFDIQPSADLSLDDFPTLAHVRDYLLASSAPASNGELVDDTSADAVVEPSSWDASPAAAASSPPVPVSEPAPAPVSAVSESSFPSTRGDTELNREELERFLINFVVEQTGYPEDIVELEADLEADLGIDSIKKAQLFGELREHFDVTPSETLSLDDFPTLGHVRDYLLAAIR